MRRIPFTGGAVVLGSKEKIVIAQQLVTGMMAQQHLNILLEDNAEVVRMAGAMERACCLAIDALQARQENDPGIAPILDQMHAELKAAFPGVGESA